MKPRSSEGPQTTAKNPESHSSWILWNESDLIIMKKIYTATESSNIMMRVDFHFCIVEINSKFQCLHQRKIIQSIQWKQLLTSVSKVLKFFKIFRSLLRTNIFEMTLTSPNKLVGIPVILKTRVTKETFLFWSLACFKARYLLYIGVKCRQTTHKSRKLSQSPTWAPLIDPLRRWYVIVNGQRLTKRYK